MIVVTTSCAPTVAFNTPGMPAHNAPASMPPTSTMGSKIGEGRWPNLIPLAVQAMAPASTLPSAGRPPPRLWRCGDVRRRGHGAIVDRLLDLVQLGFQLGRDGQVVRRVAGAVVGDAEGERSGAELVVDHVLDRGVRCDVDLLERARDD